MYNEKKLDTGLLMLGYLRCLDSSESHPRKWGEMWAGCKTMCSVEHFAWCTMKKNTTTLGLGDLRSYHGSEERPRR